MIQALQLCKEYVMGDTIVHALDGVDLTIQAGEFVSITGASGSGKSTLMHILGCLDRPTSGTLEFQGRMTTALREKQLAEVRNRHIGFVFQTFNLINRTSALDNVLLPLTYTRKRFSKKTAKAALERVGLANRARHTPGEMSGGECQRVAIARAIVNNPSLILADEPTGNLDSKTGGQIMRIFHELHASGITIVIVTHEMEVAVQADRTIHMRDGKIIEDGAVDKARRNQVLSRAVDARRSAVGPRTAAPVKPSSTEIAS
ncbi:MAG: ABC transporter ATP-binding protein [Planctomycetes bacterium]|nr:ABC transporter ATP-binding protein [Planctomycetota bacterium]